MNLRSVLYALYVFIVVLGEPIFLYWIVIPKQYLDIFYWIPFAFMVATNTSIVLEGLMSILCCLYRYCRKKRYYVWNIETGSYQSIYEGDLKRLLDHNPGKLIPKSPRNITHESTLEDHIVKVSHELPSMTIIVAAYLANERTIIEETLMSMGQIKYPGPLHVVLAYNTQPFDGQKDLLIRLNDLQARYPSSYQGKQLHIINCPGSRSKAENINCVLDIMKSFEKKELDKLSIDTGYDTKVSEEHDIIRPSDYVTIYDADHQPEVNSLIKAVYLMRKKKADILQGRCVTFNNQKFLTGIIAVEFDLMYVLHHKGGEIMRGLGFFGGSNGIWTYEALSTIRMDPNMLTEDIDSSFRAIEAGYKIIYSNNVISYELCPDTLYTLAKQRIRWAQGWFQVTLRHTCRILRCPYITCRNKLMFMMITIYREIFYYAAAQILPIVIISLATGTYQFDPLLLISTALSLFILPISLLVVNTYLALDVDHIHPPHYKKLPAYRYVIYMFVSLFYQYYMFCITVLSHFFEFLGNKEWRITQRTNSMANIVTA